MTKLALAPGTEKWLPYARMKLAELRRLRNQFDIPTTQRVWSPEAGTYVWVQTADFGDTIRITGGQLDGLYRSDRGSLVVRGAVREYTNANFGLFGLDVTTGFFYSLPPPSVSRHRRPAQVLPVTPPGYNGSTVTLDCRGHPVGVIDSYGAAWAVSEDGLRVTTTYPSMLPAVFVLSDAQQAEEATLDPADWTSITDFVEESVDATPAPLAAVVARGAGTLTYTGGYDRFRDRPVVAATYDYVSSTTTAAMTPITLPSPGTITKTYHSLYVGLLSLPPGTDEWVLDQVAYDEPDQYYTWTFVSDDLLFTAAGMVLLPKDSECPRFYHQDPNEQRATISSYSGRAAEVVWVVTGERAAPSEPPDALPTSGARSTLASAVLRSADGDVVAAGLPSIPPNGSTLTPQVLTHVARNGYVVTYGTATWVWREDDTGPFAAVTLPVVPPGGWLSPAGNELWLENGLTLEYWRNGAKVAECAVASSTVPFGWSFEHDAFKCYASPPLVDGDPRWVLLKYDPDALVFKVLRTYRETPTVEPYPGAGFEVSDVDLTQLYMVPQVAFS